MSRPREKSLHRVPLRIDWTGHWLTPTEYARVVGRPVHTVWRWCRTGVLEDFNVPVYKLSDHYWIKLTPNLFRP